MSEGFFKCAHCGFPHRAGVTVCPRTNNRIASDRATVAPVGRAKTLLSPSKTLPLDPPAPRAPKPPKIENASGWDDLVGKSIGGRYLVKGPLGRGGMGTVFEGEHIDLGRAVAIKVPSPEQVKKRNATQRFQVEARTAGAIGHPNICEVYDMGMLPDGCPYLVMERLTGATLQAKLAVEKKLAIGDAIDILRGMLAGLGAAHEKNVVHRDIKPENIFLCTEPVAEVKLVDFGVAKVYGDEEDSELNLTRTGMVMGTPYYMSSEQARGQRDLDARVDVYAAGVVLYECLAGLRPYVAPNYNALLVKIIGQDAPPLSSFRPEVGPELERVVHKAMARNRKHRFQSALEFMNALGEVDRRVALPEAYPSIEIELEESGTIPAATDVHRGWDGAPFPDEPTARDSLPEAGDSMSSLEDMPTVVMPGSMLPSSMPPGAFPDEQPASGPVPADSARRSARRG